VASSFHSLLNLSPSSLVDNTLPCTATHRFFFLSSRLSSGGPNLTQRITYPPSPIHCNHLLSFLSVTSSAFSPTTCSLYSSPHNNSFPRYDFTLPLTAGTRCVSLDNPSLTRAIRASKFSLDKLWFCYHLYKPQTRPSVYILSVSAFWSLHLRFNNLREQQQPFHSTNFRYSVTSGEKKHCRQCPLLPRMW